MKKLIFLLLTLFCVSCIPLPAQNKPRLTLSEAYEKDEINIHQQIEDNEQDCLFSHNIR